MLPAQEKSLRMRTWNVASLNGRIMEVLETLHKRKVKMNEWRQSVMVPLYKGKGDAQDCSSYRGIKLMSHTMKLWERVVEMRLRRMTSVSGSQFGFMPGKSTTDPVFIVRQMIEKYRAVKKELHLVFVDIEKAFDRVPRELLWKVLAKKGVSSKYVDVIKDMYRGSNTKVRTTCGMTNSFDVKIGVHQGSVLSPYLFVLVMDELLHEVGLCAPWFMVYADDVILIAESKAEIEERLEKVRAVLEEIKLIMKVCI
jgi:hypothetical protein